MNRVPEVGRFGGEVTHPCKRRKGQAASIVENPHNDENRGAFGIFVALAIALSYGQGAAAEQAGESPDQSKIETTKNDQTKTDQPAPLEGDYVVHDFRFQSGETLPEVRMHYTTLGSPVKDARGHTTNAVLILHGTGGTGKTFLRPIFAASCLGRDNCWTRRSTT